MPGTAFPEEPNPDMVFVREQQERERELESKLRDAEDRYRARNSPDYATFSMRVLENHLRELTEKYAQALAASQEANRQATSTQQSFTNETLKNRGLQNTITSLEASIEDKNVQLRVFGNFVSVLLQYIGEDLPEEEDQDDNPTLAAISAWVDMSTQMHNRVKTRLNHRLSEGGSGAMISIREIRRLMALDYTPTDEIPEGKLEDLNGGD